MSFCNGNFQKRISRVEISRNFNGNFQGENFHFGNFHSLATDDATDDATDRRDDRDGTMGRYTIKIQKKRGYEGGLSYVYKTNVKSWCVDSFYLYCVQYMTSGSYKYLFQRKIFCSLESGVA